MVPVDGPTMAKFRPSRTILSQLPETVPAQVAMANVDTAIAVTQVPPGQLRYCAETAHQNTSLLGPAKGTTKMNFEVAPLPFEKDALAPVMSRETFEYHYEKHHKAYMVKLKSLVEGTPESSKSLEEIIRSSSGAVFNNAAQVWNHSFFWQSLKPSGGGEPRGEIAQMITRDFGSWDKFRQAWIASGMGRFGSGWVWLVSEGGTLKILDTLNAETPLTKPVVSLLTADVWEHAYYIDYRNARQAFLEAFCDKLINWDFVAQNLKQR